jgi:hypothetical protein
MTQATVPDSVRISNLERDLKYSDHQRQSSHKKLDEVSVEIEALLEHCFASNIEKWKSNPLEMRLKFIEGIQGVKRYLDWMKSYHLNVRDIPDIEERAEAQLRKLGVPIPQPRAVDFRKLVQTHIQDAQRQLIAATSHRAEQWETQVDDCGDHSHGHRATFTAIHDALIDIQEALDLVKPSGVLARP